MKILNTTLQYFVVNRGEIVLNFIYKHIAREIIENIDIKELFLKLLSDEDCQKQILAMTDQLYERYKQKTLGSLGGLQKGMNYATAPELPSIFNAKGGISLKTLLPTLIQGFLSKQGEKQGGLP